MNMLDPTAIADPQNYTPEDIKGLCIRRFKKDVKDQVSGSFLERKITLERCNASAKEEYAFDIFTEMQLEMDLGKTKGTGQLFKTSLEKSLFSSPAACIKSIEARLKKLYKKYTADDIKDIHLLENLKTALEAITPADFTRYQKLLDLLKSKEYAWNPADSGDRVVIFTERIETMKYLAERLRQDLGLKANAIQEISGGISDAEQQRIVEDFGRTESSVRVLVASDVASEGLNLHYLSHRLIHFDIPWSLMVFQQRNGRIDRYGQQKRPDIRYMLIESDNKRIKGDMRIIEILITKEEQALKNIGDPSLLLGKFTIEDEELVVAETIESGSDSDVFEQTLDQQKAFERLTGDDGRSTLVATGTGSGKTECFLYPILEYCYQHRGERGIKALIIYPMNALATDQAKRIAELIYGSDELRGNVTVGMYVGGQDHTPARTMSEHGVITDHETMLNNAPDILMTNYKMLDYLLVRPKDALLWQDNNSETLKYIAVDELHTFDGAQGTDLACLLRRLKRRLGIYDGYLCCVGTSATMGSKENNSSILNYAEEIFGEPFDKDAIITEDRLSAQEFFAGAEATEFTLPTVEQAIELEKLSEEDEPSAYLQSAVKDWLPNFSFDVLDDEGRIQLGYELMHHSFMQSVINLTGGTYYQVSKIAEDLAVHYPDLKNLPDADVVINSLFALISHARTGKVGKLRPFLNVQVQLWMRELRRLVAKVDSDEITYEIAHDLNKQQAKQYLPVVNCRDCGITGWVSVLNERSNATMTNLESFYLNLKQRALLRFALFSMTKRIVEQTNMNRNGMAFGDSIM